MKQRLTDTNELMKLIPSEEMTSKLAVANAPTVEAIPVKWLEDYQIKEFIKADPNSVEFQRACGVGCAIEAWRKENATD